MRPGSSPARFCTDLHVGTNIVHANFDLSIMVQIVTRMFLKAKLTVRKLLAQLLLMLVGSACNTT